MQRSLYLWFPIAKGALNVSETFYMIRRLNMDVIKQYWGLINGQKWEELSSVFHPDSMIYWPNTNEKFMLDEFILVNKRYPGCWRVTIKHVLVSENTQVSVAKVTNECEGISCHATSICEIKDGKIQTLYEYWGDYAQPPQWRRALGIGSKI